MAENMMGDIITDHRERMLNLKKYYPFFKLIDTNFSQFKDGKYEYTRNTANDENKVYI